VEDDSRITFDGALPPSVMRSRVGARKDLPRRHAASFMDPNMPKHGVTIRH